MICAKCHSDNLADAVFCAECGARMEQACSACETTNPPKSKFCRKCGNRLAAAEPPLARAAAIETSVRITPDGPSEELQGERKTVTALFADIKGSMELMEDLDPEEARAIVDPALKLMIDAVHRYDGYVVQSTGDGILALFGAPVAHEDHPQRALYAALRLQEELKRYSDRMRQEGRLPLQARVGVNTGEVVVRSIQTGEAHTEYTPIGHTANLAARMQVLAPIGSIATTEQVRKLCEGYFLFNGLGPTKVKGVSEPVNVYEVTGLGPLRTRLQRAVGRGLTKFVGRTREMEAMQHAAEQAKAGHGQIVAAMAEPGVGKSRLFFEFKATSQSGWMVLETFSVSHGKASAYLPVIDLLRNYFKIVSEDDERTRREKVAGKIAILDRSLEDTLPYLFALLGIVEGDDPLAQMDGQVKKRRTLEAIKRIVLRESLNQPLVLIFEDLHWIDEETQSLLNLLVESIGNAKVLLLVNYRPEYTHQWNSKTYYTQLNLDPLGQESAAEMLSALLGDGKDLTPLKRLIIERTEGTPFFMEEMVQALFEDGVLQRNGIVKLSKSMKEVKVPATVQAILASRIDNLPAPEKELLQALAVIGKEFSLGIVKRTVRTSADELDRMLGNLQLREFIYEQPAVGDVEYSFKHALTQEVAYNALLVERRKPLHERAGQALESLFAEQLDDHLDELAHHYSHSANSAKAVQYLEAAAQQSTRRSAYPEAISLATSGLDMSKALPESEERDRHEINLQMTLGQCRFVMDGWAAQRSGQAYQRALELCRRIGESGLAATALLGLQQFYLGRGELRKSHELDEELLALAHSTGNDGLLYEAMYLSGLTLYHTGDFVAARRNHEWVGKAESPREISAGLSEHPSVGCQAYLSVELWHLGYPDQAAAAVEEALRRAREESHPFSLAFAMMFAVLLRILRREADLAVNTGEALVAMASEHEIGSFVMYGRMYLGWALSMQGHADKGIAAIRESVEASRAMSAGLAVPSMLIASAEIKARLGETAAALTVADDAIAQIGRNGEFSSESDAYRLKGELLLMQGAPDRAGAERCFAKALDVAHTQRAKSLELRAIMSLARLLAKQGRPAEARAMLAEIYGWFTEGFDTADLKDAKSLLEELGA